MASGAKFRSILRDLVARGKMSADQANNLANHERAGRGSTVRQILRDMVSAGKFDADTANTLANIGRMRVSESEKRRKRMGEYAKLAGAVVGGVVIGPSIVKGIVSLVEAGVGGAKGVFGAVKDLLTKSGIVGGVNEILDIVGKVSDVGAILGDVEKAGRAKDFKKRLEREYKMGKTQIGLQRERQAARATMGRRALREDIGERGFFGTPYYKSKKGEFEAEVSREAGETTLKERLMKSRYERGLLQDPTWLEEAFGGGEGRSGIDYLKDTFNTWQPKSTEPTQESTSVATTLKVPTMYGG